MKSTCSAALAASLLLCCAGAQTPASPEPQAQTSSKHVIVSTARPRDSQGDIVYSQDPKVPSGAHVITGTFIVPKLLHQTEPKYPESMRRHKAAGSVTLEGVITPQGNIIDLSVYKTDVPADAVAEASADGIEAVRTYKFSPATLDGKPVAMLVRISVQYRIFDDHQP